MTKVVDSEMRFVALSKIVHVNVDPAVTDNENDSDPNLVNVVVDDCVRGSVSLRLLRSDCELDVDNVDVNDCVMVGVSVAVV